MDEPPTWMVKELSREVDMAVGCSEWVGLGRLERRRNSRAICTQWTGGSKV